MSVGADILTRNIQREAFSHHMRHPILIICSLFIALFFLEGRMGSAQTPSERSLLWKIEGNGLTEPSYIYGTMHVQHKDVFDLADSVLPALAACRWFATEVNLDTMSRIYIERLLGVDDTASTDEGEGIEGKSFIRGMFHSRRSTPEEAVETDYPGGDESESSGSGRWNRFGDIVSRSRTPEEDGPVFLDAWLFQTAKRLGKKLLGVEDVIEHMNVLDDGEDDENDGDDGGRSRSRSIWRSMSIQRKMLEAYRKGDVTRIESLMRESLEPHRFHEILTRRNRIMVASITEYIAQAPTFVAVGAGHLGGEYGVIALLRDRGYKVTPVRPTKSHKPPKVVIPNDPLPWKTLDDAGGAFTVDLPLDPVAARLDSVDEDEPLIRVWMMADAGGGLLYMIYSVDVPSSYSNPFLGELLPAFTSSWMRALEGDSLTTTDISLKGMAGKEGVVKGEEVSYRMRFYMRGARLYVLAVAGDERLIGGDDADRFFGSFRTKPVVPHEWRKITLKEDGVEIELPGRPIDGEEEARYMPSATIRNVASRDPNSGRIYSLQVIRYSPYYHTGPVEEYWKRIVSDWVGPTQMGTDSAIVVNGFTGRDITAVDTIIHVVTRVRSIIAGRRLIEIWGVGGVENEGAEAMDRFIGSLRMIDTTVDGDIRAPHARQILDDIASEESGTRAKARLEIPEYPWERQDIPLLYAAIQRDYPWDENSGRDGSDLATSTPELLIRGLRRAWDSTTVSFLRQSYTRFAGDVRLKGTIVDVLAAIGTVESVSAMLELLRSESDPLPGFSIYSLSDSLPRIASLLPEIVRLAEVRKYRLSILQLIENGLDSGYITADLFRQTGLAAICRSSIDERVNPPEWAEDEKGGLTLREQWAGVAIRILGWLEKSDENIRSIKELLPDSNSVLAMSATVALIRMTGSAPGEYVNRFAADSSLVIWFYTELQSTAPRLFPAFWKRQAHFAMGGLIRWIIRDYGEEPSEVRYVAQREIDVDGGRGRVFLFKFRLSDREWYMGIGGPQPINPTDVSIDDSFSRSRYRPLSSFSIDRHFKDLLER